MSVHHRASALSVATLLLLTMASHASRAEEVTGSIAGIVLRDGETPLAGIWILLTDRDTGREWRARSNGAGRFRISDLPIGLSFEWHPKRSRKPSRAARSPS